jgi:hypothetical protein
MPTTSTHEQLRQLDPEKRTLIEQISQHVQHASGIKAPHVFLVTFAAHLPRAPRLADNLEAWRAHAERISAYCAAYTDLCRASSAFTACVEQNQSGRVH